MGPVLAGVLVTAASSTTMVQGAVLLCAYSLGLGPPFLLLAVARGRGLTWLRRQGRKIEVFGALLFVVMSVAVMSGQRTVMMS